MKMPQERPRPINQVLGKQERTIGPEDIAALTEQELLGLDKPIHELVTKDKSLHVPKAVRYLYEGTDPTVSETLFARFGLNSGRYDSESNPSGLFLGDPPKSRGANSFVNYCLLRLGGVRSSDINTFFEASSPKGKHDVSPAFFAALERANMQRETFPLRHLNQFPTIEKSLQEIKRLGGLEPDELFTPGYTPEVFEWRGHGDKLARERTGREPILLDEALRILMQALSGTMTLEDISRANGRNHVNVSNFLFNKLGPRLNERALALVQEKIKRAAPGKKSVSPSE